MIEYDLFNTKWECGLEGGRIIHPDFPNSYHSTSAIKIYNPNLVELTINKNPRTIEYWDGTIFHPTYGAGIIKSCNSYSYGIFEAHIRMPKGRNLWPSFWLTGTNSWPPEIDIVEGYTNKLSSYLKCFNWKLENNIHYSSKENYHEQINPSKVNIFKLFNNPIYNSLKYMVIWTKYKIDFYIENILIRSIIDKKVLDFINKDPWMNVVFQMGVPKNYSDKDLKSLKQPMIIENFRYTKLHQ